MEQKAYDLVLNTAPQTPKLYITPIIEDMRKITMDFKNQKDKGVEQEFHSFIISQVQSKMSVKELKYANLIVGTLAVNEPNLEAIIFNLI